MRKSCRRPSLVGGKRCRHSQYLPPAGSTSRSRPPPSETRYRRDPCGRARTSLSVRAKTPFTPPPQFYTTTYTTTIFCLPGFYWDAMGRPNSRKSTAGQRVSGISGTSREPLGIPVLSSETEGAGFEPAEGFPSPVFKTGAINHSTTPPRVSLPGGANSGRRTAPVSHGPPIVVGRGLQARRDREPSNWLGMPWQPPGSVARERLPLQLAR